MYTLNMSLKDIFDHTLFESNMYGKSLSFSYGSDFLNYLDHVYKIILPFSLCI